jgi:hypothetical protein
MKSAEGRMFWNTGVYNEVEPNKKIVATMSFANQEGRAIPGAQAPVLGRWPDKIIVITEFSEVNGHTRVAVTEVGIPLFVKVLQRLLGRSSLTRYRLSLKVRHRARVGQRTWRLARSTTDRPRIKIV